MIKYRSIKPMISWYLPWHLASIIKLRWRIWRNTSTDCPYSIGYVLVLFQIHYTHKSDLRDLHVIFLRSLQYIPNPKLIFNVPADVLVPIAASPSADIMLIIELDMSSFALSNFTYHCWPDDIITNGWRDLDNSRGTSSVATNIQMKSDNAYIPQVFS